MSSGSETFHAGRTQTLLQTWNAPCAQPRLCEALPCSQHPDPRRRGMPQGPPPKIPAPGTFPQGPRPRDPTLDPGSLPSGGWEHTGAETPPAQGRHRCEVTRKEATPRTLAQLARIVAHGNGSQGCSILEGKKFRTKAGDAKTCDALGTGEPGGGSP